jgi:hypothetical protein
MTTFPATAVLAVVGLAGLVACRPPEPPPRPRWTATTPEAADLASARQECIDHATAKTQSIHQEDIASKVAIAEFIRCMEGRGWRLERGAEGGAAAPPR